MRDPIPEFNDSRIPDSRLGIPDSRFGDFPIRDWGFLIGDWGFLIADELYSHAAPRTPLASPNFARTSFVATRSENT